MPQATRPDGANDNRGLTSGLSSSGQNGKRGRELRGASGQEGTGSKELGAVLRERVTDRVFLDLATGLYKDHLRSNGGTSADDTLDTLYHATLRLLFRLLVVFFAEARGFLPVEDDKYSSLSLSRLARCVRRAYANGEGLSACTTRVWEDVNTLFRIVREGDPALNVVPIGSRLFEKCEADALYGHYSIGPEHLVRTLVDLTAVDPEDDPAGPEIDYASLEVRELGAIYEELLDRRLVRDGEGDLQLEVMRGGRRATGAFYTPQSIVEHIVEEALGPIVDERLAPFEEVMENISELRSKNSHELGGKLQEYEQQAFDSLFTLRVCDPTMGSGHFLIQTVDYLAKRFAEVINRYPEHNPVTERLVAYREEILSYSESQGMTLQDADHRLRHEVLLKQFVAEHCLYGVDLDAMAVELSRISIWLSAFMPGTSPYRLKNHLKLGNALIGAEIDSLLRAAGNHVRGTILSMPQTGTGDLPRRLEGCKGFLDLWTSQYFENEEARTLACERAGELIEAFETGEGAILKEHAKTVEAARRLREEKRFFHWELEFPEVFYSPRPAGETWDPGFDAVVGNPPYVSVRRLIDSTPDERGYFVDSGRYATASHVWDLYMLATERSTALLRDGGRSSLIVPVTFLHQQNAAPLRRAMLRSGAIETVVDLSGVTPFEEALVKTAIFVFEKGSDCAYTSVYRPSRSDGLADDGARRYRVAREELERDPEVAIRPGLGPGAIDVVRKIRQRSVELSEILYPTFGLRPSPKEKGAGTRDRLLTRDGEHPEAERYIGGRDVSRYCIDWRGNYVLYRPEQMYSGRFEELFEYPKLLVRAVLADKNLVAVVDRDGFYADQTLVCCARPEFIRGKTSVSASENAYGLEFIAALLNSRLASFYFRTAISGDSLGGGAVHCTPGMTARLPIRQIDFSTPAAKREALSLKTKVAFEKACDEIGSARVKTSHETYLEGASLQCEYDTYAAPVLDLVGMHLGAERERADVVHDLLTYLAREMARMKEKRQALDLDIANHVGNISEDNLCLGDWGCIELTHSAEASPLGATRSDYDSLRIGTLSAEQDENVVLLFATARYKPPVRADREIDRWGYTETETLRVGRLDANSNAEATFVAHWLSAVSDRAGGFAGYRRNATKHFSLLDRIRAIRMPNPAAMEGQMTDYLDTVARAKELERQRTFTDRLIDLTIYRLYDLSEEEVRLVERPGF